MEARTLAYMRASTNKQELEIQHDLLSRAGYDELFQEHISGQRRDRPEFRRMVDRALELSKSGHRVYVVVVNDSRFARDVITSLSEIERLESAGVTIRSLEGGAMSLTTPEDFLLTVVKAATAQHYSLNLSREIKKNYEWKRQQKLPLCNRVPWPYQRAEDKRLEPNPQAWPVAREVVDRLLRGDTVNSCLHWLRNDHGIERSRAWVRMWVANPTMRGHTPYTIGGRTRAEKGVFKPTHVIYNTHPALMTEVEYQAIERSFADRRGRRGRNQNGRIYPVPSVVWCACGRKANPALAPNGSRRHRCQWLHCPNRLPSTRDDRIEAAIQEAIVEAAEALAEAVLAAELDVPTDPRILQLEDDLNALKPLAHRPAVAAEIAEIEMELGQLKVAPDLASVGAAERREMVAGLAGLTSEEWDALEPGKRRQMYGELVERVVVQGGEVLEVVLRV